MSTPAFAVALVGLIALAIVIRRSRFALHLTLALVGLLVVSLTLLTLGVKLAGWGALVTIAVISSVLFRTAMSTATSRTRRGRTLRIATLFAGQC